MARQLRGIDVSSHDGFPMKSDTAKCYGESDFCIVKATQGTGYTNPYMEKYADRVTADKKLLGFYHYAGGNSATKEAEFFYSKVKKHVGKAIMCLDWESIQNKAWGDKSWCKAFCDHFRKLSGVRCIVYVQASAVAQCANCAKTYGLWLAGYPDNRKSWVIPAFRYSTGAWDDYDIWQYTSGGETVDRNTSKLTAKSWAAWAAVDGKQTEAAKPTTSAKKYRVTAKNGLNYRKGAGTSYAVAGVYKFGKVVEITDTKTVGGKVWGKGSNGYWCQLTSYTEKV